MKKQILLLSLALLGARAQAAEGVEAERSSSVVSSVTEAFDKPKFGGYFVGKYSWSDQAGKNTNGGFDLRFVRLYLDGHCMKDFYYRLQGEVNGAPGKDSGPRLVDAFVEWQRYAFFKVKLGQYKRPFTFENPYNPWNVGFGSYSQLVTKLAGMSDRTGEHKSGGRDVGLQFQGDLFPARRDRYAWLHYQVGLFNGQGINHSDKDKFKDLIGGLWISPVKALSIGGFGWSGRYANEGYAGAENTLKQVKRNRWGVGLKYEGDWTFRSEYVASQGGCVTNAMKADKADGWYMALGYPVTPTLKVYGKWDCYRDSKEWESMTTIWALAGNYYLSKNLLLQANYSFTIDKTQAVGRNYHTLDFQLYARF